eukprot:TRINITY_DN9907_c0_g1_i2.p1 TRINITY_DN9907_c0_g1~~TRINITY_DN9907_c0_g1_i2.p1  ORF type:complete len:449 (-),score=92.68 TRINITY_DN9907_c0_g1_i2:1584-2930(-)
MQIPPINSPVQLEVAQRQQDGENVGLVLCVKVWIVSLMKALVIVIPVLSVLWILYLPALVMTQELLDQVKEIAYVKLQVILAELSNYGFVTMYGVIIFGYFFMKNALFYCFLPGSVLHILVSIFVSNLFSIIIHFFVILVALLILSREKLPETPSQALLEQFERKKQVSKPFGKMTAVLLVVYFLLALLYRSFLNASLGGKIFIRFITLPFLTISCTSLQMYFLKSVQKRHIDFVIPMLWMTNGYLKMLERIFTNGISDSGDYVSFLMTTLAAALIEIVNHATYFYRSTLVNKFVEYLHKFQKTQFRPVRTVSVTPAADDSQENVDSRQLLRNEREWMADMRKKLIIEDVSIELMMIFTVTFLLYFINPLVENQRIETIPTFKICTLQLVIQIIFEFASDVFGIYWTINRDQIRLLPNEIEIKNRWFWIWILFIFWQSLQIFYFLVSF